ncbi:MAG: hypothetical protein LBR23_08525, partial [Spirochaetaceae bacterium]|nr:hypothetical protein [Spirochaetaceae bacterium]
MTATFIPVEDIEADFEATALSGVPLALTAAVKPDYATNRAVGWSIVSSGTTNASLAGNVLTASDGGTVTVRGTIINGVSQDPQVHFV